MADTKKRTNDLYCRDMPSAKAIEEIKHLAAIKRVTVGVIVHREHNLVKAIRQALAEDRAPGWDEIGDLLIKHGLGLTI